MASTPVLKIYDGGGEYIAACKHGEHAAALVALEGDGATIRFNGHTRACIVWTEGREAFPASDSYDGVANLILERVRERRAARA